MKAISAVLVLLFVSHFVFAQIDEARKHFAYVMFASFCGLLLGAGAAYAAGMATTGAAIKQAAKPVT